MAPPRVRRARQRRRPHRTDRPRWLRRPEQATGAVRLLLQRQGDRYEGRGGLAQSRWQSLTRAERMVREPSASSTLRPVFALSHQRVAGEPIGTRRARFALAAASASDASRHSCSAPTTSSPGPRVAPTSSRTSKPSACAATAENPPENGDPAEPRRAKHCVAPARSGGPACMALRPVRLGERAAGRLPFHRCPCGLPSADASAMCFRPRDQAR